MDILAHGLWTNAIYEIAARHEKRMRTKKETRFAIFFGIAPDLIAFGFPVIFRLVRGRTLWSYANARFQSEWGDMHILSSLVPVPAPIYIPSYVYTLYNFTHSFVIFAAVFCIVWMLRGRPYSLLGAWGLHIGIDIFSHNNAFFPTPIFFPLSRFYLSGVSWADPTFMVVNYSSLAFVYFLLYRTKMRQRRRLEYSKFTRQ